MQVINSVKDMQTWSAMQKTQGLSIGLVPTMGYLHAGHMTLVGEARQNCDRVIVSIFVNPIQFGVGEDYEVYPRDLERDQSLLQEAGVDVLFSPPVAEMYPPGFSAFVEIEGEITAKLCGAFRPGHFRGVTTVVSKLFNLALPDRAYFGQKDAQQLLVLEKMVRDLNFPLEIIRVPIVREADGLAMSSRNVYLKGEQREQALVLSRSLQTARTMIADGARDPEKVKENMLQIISHSPLARVEYIEIAKARDLSAMETLAGEIIIALAVKIGNTRLIDNVIMEVDA